jgi:hypothetical protein
MSEEEIKLFDFFNDYTDTKRYLLRINNIQVLEMLDKYYQQWLAATVA